MIFDGFIGTIYVRTEEISRMDLWSSDVWPKAEDVLDEMLESELSIIETLSKNTEDYEGYIDRDDYDDDFDPEQDPDNQEYFATFKLMLAEARENVRVGKLDDSYGNVEILIEPKSTHIPQLTENEWARICEGQSL